VFPEKDVQPFIGSPKRLPLCGNTSSMCNRFDIFDVQLRGRVGKVSSKKRLKEGVKKNFPTFTNQLLVRISVSCLTPGKKLVDVN
jgi:hypothetical protein